MTMVWKLLVALGTVKQEKDSEIGEMIRQDLVDRTPVDEERKILRFGQHVAADQVVEIQEREAVVPVLRQLQELDQIRRSGEQRCGVALGHQLGQGPPIEDVPLEETNVVTVLQHDREEKAHQLPQAFPAFLRRLYRLEPSRQFQPEQTLVHGFQAGIVQTPLVLEVPGDRGHVAARGLADGPGCGAFEATLCEEPASLLQDPCSGIHRKGA